MTHRIQSLPTDHPSALPAHFGFYHPVQRRLYPDGLVVQEEESLRPSDGRARMAIAWFVDQGTNAGFETRAIRQPADLGVLVRRARRRIERSNG